MTTKEIEKGNKLIAEFMGLNECKRPYFGTFTYTHSERLGALFPIIEKEMEGESWYVYPRFHESWDWLIPVVEKIESLGFVFQIQQTDVIIFDYSKEQLDGTGQNIILTILFKESKIECTYLAVIEFIKWYNEQK